MELAVSTYNISYYRSQALFIIYPPDIHLGKRVKVHLILFLCIACHDWIYLYYYIQDDLRDAQIALFHSMNEQQKAKEL